MTSPASKEDAAAASKAAAEELKDDKWRAELREKCAKVAAEGRQDLGKRDKSIAKIQKFTNRLRRFADADKSALLDESRKLNLSMYTSEIGQLLGECNFKLKDVAAAVEFAMHMHAEYEDFSRALKDAIVKSFTTTTEGSADQSASARKKVCLRLYSELYLTGICPDAGPIASMLKDVCSPGKGKTRDDCMQHLSILESFCKRFAGPLLGAAGRRQSGDGSSGGEWEREREREVCADGEVMNRLSGIISEFYRSEAREVLVNCHKDFMEQESRNQQLKIYKGEIPPEDEQKYQSLQATFSKVETYLAALSELLDLPMPELQEREADTKGPAGPATRLKAPGEDAAAAGGEGESEGADANLKWEDEADRSFYEDLVDLKDKVPPELLRIRVEDKPEAGGDDDNEDEEGDDEQDDDTADDDSPTAAAKDASSPPSAAAAAASAPASAASPSQAGGPGPGSPSTGPDGERKRLNFKKVRKRNQGKIAAYLNKIKTIEKREAVDDLAVEFFHLCTKSNRNKITQMLSDTYGVNLALLPFFARLVATISPYSKEVGQGVVEKLRADFTKYTATKDPVDLESKVKNVRYLSELCKCGVCPPGVMMDYFNSLIEDLTPHHAEMAVHLLQVCGRYLLYTPETSTRFQNLLDKMQRLKNVKNLQYRLEIMLDEAHLHVKPSDRKVRPKKEKPPMRRFIDRLIFVNLYDDDESDKVLKLVRKLPWQNEQVVKWLKKDILDLGMNVNYESIHQLACLLAGLARYRDAFVIDVIDQLTEDIQVGMERNDFRELPSRVRQVKLLGELYNYRLADSSVIFDTLYHLIGFGGPSSHHVGQLIAAHKLLDASLARLQASLASIPETQDDEADPKFTGWDQNTFWNPCSPEDPPGDYFRLKLVCIMLDTCGAYFERGPARHKMDRFLVFFQRYCLIKAPLPMRVEYMVRDTLGELRPKLRRYDSIGEVDSELREILKQESEQLREQGMLDQRDEEEEGEGEGEGEYETGDEVETDQDNEADEEEQEDEYFDDDERDPDYDRGEHHDEEEDWFEKELNSMVQESIETAKFARSKADEIRLPPSSLIKRGEDGGESDSRDASPTSPARGHQPSLKLVTKKGHSKYSVKPLPVPQGHQLWSHTMRREEAQREAELAEQQEREQLKMFVKGRVENFHQDERRDVAGSMRRMLMPQPGGSPQGVTVLSPQSAFAAADTARLNPHGPLGHVKRKPMYVAVTKQRPYGRGGGGRGGGGRGRGQPSGPPAPGPQRAGKSRFIQPEED
ncbi:unnamed protein product [Vitrella brassicaformis CCMP3155]|uniref:MIF4G domain-containing protein n=3 Tax=Vitrella brassicaformis TaxID=1169539 RepID=A0A0G4FE64_VITBC|nr:unnamed protein product [Vitrella brassicaformis CCMP3155]|eukprot:CEM11495.1 unnamed protein product [Vitrella brassicaformis CCMP3155]